MERNGRVPLEWNRSHVSAGVRTTELPRSAVGGLKVWLTNRWTRTHLSVARLLLLLPPPFRGHDTPPRLRRVYKRGHSCRCPTPRGVFSSRRRRRRIWGFRRPPRTRSQAPSGGRGGGVAGRRGWLLGASASDPPCRRRRGFGCAKVPHALSRGEYSPLRLIVSRDCGCSLR
jgi:hypothetical protein